MGREETVMPRRQLGAIRPKPRWQACGAARLNDACAVKALNARGEHRTRQLVIAFSLSLALAIFGNAKWFVAPALAAPRSSQNIAYVYDFGSGVNDPAGPGQGSGIFTNAITGTPPGSGNFASYTGT